MDLVGPDGLLKLARHSIRQTVRKRQRRLAGVDEIVLSLSAKGLTTGEIAAHFAEVFGARVSKDTLSPSRRRVIGEMTEW